MRRLRITIGDKSYEVTVEDLTETDPYPGATSPAPPLPTSNLPASNLPASNLPASPLPPSHATPLKAPATTPRGASEAGAVTSPMAGVIRAVLVKLTEQVKSGQPLVVLEAMKMENQITAPVAGTVTRIDVKEGESVAEGHVLVVLE